MFKGARRFALQLHSIVARHAPNFSCLHNHVAVDSCSSCMLGQASCTWTGTCLLDCHSSAPHTARTIQPEATLRLQSKPCQNRSCPTAHCHIPPTATLPPHRHPSSSYERSRKCKSDGSLYGTNTTTLLRRFCAHPPLYMPPRSTDLRTTYL